MEIAESGVTELPLLAIEISNWRRSGRRLRLETTVPSGNPWRTVTPSYYFWVSKSPIGDVLAGGFRWRRRPRVETVESGAELPLLAIEISNWRSCYGRLRLGQVEEIQVAKNLRVVAGPAEYVGDRSRSRSRFSSRTC
jgi:hypothetical protein